MSESPPLERSYSDAESSSLGAKSQASSVRKWLYSEKEIKDQTPSRRDGIDYSSESTIRTRYCLFLRDIGIKLPVRPEVVGKSMLFCHLFFMRHSLAKNDWQTIATACLLLASKSEEYRFQWKHFASISYELMNHSDPLVQQKVTQEDVLDKHWQIIIPAEEALLKTIEFNFSMDLPYEYLLQALTKLKISNKVLEQAATNYIHSWLCTTLSLQYKSRHLAAGSLYGAARTLGVGLPMERGNPWWLKLGISETELREVTRRMKEVTDHEKQQPESALSWWKLMRESRTSRPHSAPDPSRDISSVPGNDGNAAAHTGNDGPSADDD